MVVVWSPKHSISSLGIHTSKNFDYSSFVLTIVFF